MTIEFGRGVCAICEITLRLDGQGLLSVHFGAQGQKKCRGSRKRPMEAVTDDVKQDELDLAAQLERGRKARTAARQPIKAAMAARSRKGLPPSAWEVRG